MLILKKNKIVLPLFLFFYSIIFRATILKWQLRNSFFSLYFDNKEFKAYQTVKSAVTVPKHSSAPSHSLWLLAKIKHLNSEINRKELLSSDIPVTAIKVKRTPIYFFSFELTGRGWMLTQQAGLGVRDKELLERVNQMLRGLEDLREEKRLRLGLFSLRKSTLKGDFINIWRAERKGMGPESSQ